MIKFENTEVLGWEHAIRGMRNPMNSWNKSDSDCVHCMGFDPAAERDCESCDVYIGPNDHDLMMRLVKGGPVHAKYRRMITLYATIIAPLYWWKEFDTYKVGTVANSCSTMHKIAAKEFDISDFSAEHLETMARFDEDGEPHQPYMVMKSVIDCLNACRETYLKTKDKTDWWQMIQLLPSSYNQKRTVMLNYEVLANIYKSRKDHKLDEWHDFCDWIKTLPYSELITGAKIEEKEDSPWISCTDENAKMPEDDEEIICTLKEDWSFGESTDIQYHVCEGLYKTNKDDSYDIPAANGKGYFETCNDWAKGQPLSVIAWMPKPVPYKE